MKDHTLLGYCKPSRRSPATAGVDGQGPIIHNGSKSSVSSPLNKKDASLLYFFLAKFDRDVDVNSGTFRVSTAKPITSRDGAYLLCLEGSREKKTGLWLGSKDMNVCGPCPRRLFVVLRLIPGTLGQHCSARDCMYVGPEGPDVRRENPAVIQGGPALGWTGTNRFDDGIPCSYS